MKFALFFALAAIAPFVTAFFSWRFGLGDGMRKARIIVLGYAMECSETAVKYADDESATGQVIYWRADGASDALDIIAEKLNQD